MSDSVGVHLECMWSSGHELTVPMDRATKLKPKLCQTVFLKDHECVINSSLSIHSWDGIPACIVKQSVYKDKQTKILHDRGRAFPECSMWLSDVLHLFSNGQSKLWLDKPQKGLTSQAPVPYLHLIFRCNHDTFTLNYTMTKFKNLQRQWFTDTIHLVAALPQIRETSILWNANISHFLKKSDRHPELLLLTDRHRTTKDQAFFEWSSHQCVDFFSTFTPFQAVLQPRALSL